MALILLIHEYLNVYKDSAANNEKTMSAIDKFKNFQTCKRLVSINRWGEINAESIDPRQNMKATSHKKENHDNSNIIENNILKYKYILSSLKDPLRLTFLWLAFGFKGFSISFPRGPACFLKTIWQIYHGTTFSFTFTNKMLQGTSLILDKHFLKSFVTHPRKTQFVPESLKVSSI